jgi:type II secretory pathway component PulJ
VVPHLIALALVGAGLYAGYRWFVRANQQLAAEVERTQEELRRQAAGGVLEKDMGRLEYDAATGVYRPARR